MRYGILILIVLFILTTSSCSTNISGYTNEIEDLNVNSNLDFNFAEDEKDIKEVDEFKKVGGFGCYLLTSKDSLTNYIIGGYPDCLDRYKVIGFQTQNPIYSIYGVSVGINVADAIELLESKSYKKDPENSNECRLIYKNGKVTISVTIESSHVSELSVRLEVTNKNNVQF